MHHFWHLFALAIQNPFSIPLKSVWSDERLNYLFVVLEFYCQNLSTKTNFSSFSGYKMSRPLCRNRMTSQEVEESLCNAVMRPEPAVIQCNTHSCPPK